MGEKLTKEGLQEWFDTVERINGARPDALAVYSKIEADREATRADIQRSTRTCFKCEHLSLCFLRHNVDNALRSGLNLLNVDEPAAAPNSYIKVFESLAGACLKFQERPQ